MTDPALAPGGLATTAPEVSPPARQVTLLQRKAGKLGAGLGKTTGWIHRTALKHKHVKMIGGVNYERIGDEGLRSSATVKSAKTRPGFPATRSCSAPASCRCARWPMSWRRKDKTAHVIGGALEAGELDAKRAIDQAARLAARL